VPKSIVIIKTFSVFRFSDGVFCLVGRWVDLDMINRITLLLFIGLAWGQVEQDKLVLKDGTKYLGEFSTIDGKNVLFKPEGAFGFQPISINKIKIKEPIH